MSIIIKKEEYIILEEIAKGKNSIIVKVMNKRNNSIYAVKKISIKNLVKEEIFLIEKEAENLSTVNCEQIVKYYGSSKDSNYYYILMEYFDGINLKKYINILSKINRNINEIIIEKIIVDLCLGLKEIHDKKIIHRDLKPENILINGDYQIKICDFGNSKKLDFINSYALASIGTYNYMAPEIIEGEIYDEKVDIWALRCIIYELLSLKMCFENKSPFELINSIINENHKVINTSSKWNYLIDLLLKKNADKRPNINNLYESFIKKNCKISNISEDQKKIRKLIVLGPKEANKLRAKGKHIYYLNSK